MDCMPPGHSRSSMVQSLAELSKSSLSDRLQASKPSNGASVSYAVDYGDDGRVFADELPFAMVDEIMDDLSARLKNRLYIFFQIFTFARVLSIRC